VPKWKDSRLSFKNVYVSRRPNEKIAKRTVKGAGHIAAAGYDVGNHPVYHHVGDEDDEPETHAFEDEDTNYTMFDLNIDSVDVTLSLTRWLDGKGLVEDAVVRGVRGVVGKHCRYRVVQSQFCLTTMVQTAETSFGMRMTLQILPNSDTSHDLETLN